MTNIFSRFWEIWKPSFLSKFLKEKKVSLTWRFWFFWNTMFAFFVTILFVIFILQPFLKDTYLYVKNETPNFRFDLKDGKLSSNLEQTAPFVFKTKDDSGEDFIFILDTKHHIYNNDYIDRINNGILVTDTAFLAKDAKKYKITKFPFSEIKENFVVTKEDVLSKYDLIKTKILYILGFITFVLLFLFFAIFRLLMAFWWALIWFILAKIFKLKDLDYMKSYFMILNLYFIPLLLDMILIFLGIDIPFFTLFIFSVLFALNYQFLKKTKQKS